MHDCATARQVHASSTIDAEPLNGRKKKRVRTLESGNLSCQIKNLVCNDKITQNERLVRRCCLAGTETLFEACHFNKVVNIGV
jgi:hypothetical protein